MKAFKYLLPFLFCTSLIVFAHQGAIYLYFILLPIMSLLNQLLGEYSEPELRDELAFFENHPLAQQVKLANVFALSALNIWALWFVFSQQPSGWEMGLLLFAMAHTNGSFTLTLAHELEHAQSKLLLWAGDLLLVWMGLPFFRDDHIFGHHQLIGTPDDHTCAKTDQSFYHFIIGAVRQRVVHSYFKKSGLPERCRQKNIRFTWLLAAFGMALLAIHPILFFFWLGQVAGVVWLYELANYIQHYGLKRQPNEPVGLHHSWNCYSKYCNCFFFLMPAHSVHHVGKPLEEMPTLMGPRLPYSFAFSLLLALVPPLWFRMMNPAVERLESGIYSALQSEEGLSHKNSIPQQIGGIASFWQGSGGSKSC